MKFAAAALLAVVLFSDVADARPHRRPNKPKRGRSDRAFCKYVEDANDKTSDWMVVGLSQKKSDTVPNPNAIKMGGNARNFTANDGDTLTLKSYDAIACAGTPKTISDAITAKERTSRKSGSTVMTARFPRSKDETGAELSSFASF